MRYSHRILLFLSVSCLRAGYQNQTDGLTAIDPAKWTQNGTLSAASSGVTGNGSLISTVAVPTGSDHDVRMTIRTSKQGDCEGSYSLFARSTPDNSTSYVLTINTGSVGLYRKIANSWTSLTWLPYFCSDGTTMRLSVRGSDLTIWVGPNAATYHDPTPIAAGRPGVGISSTDSIANVQIGPADNTPPNPIDPSSVESSVAPNRVDLRWHASSDDANGIGLQGYVVYRDGVYLGTSLTPDWLDQTVPSGASVSYSIYAADQHGNLSAPAVVKVAVPLGLGNVRPGAESHLGRPTAESVPSGPQADQREVGVRPNGAYYGAAGEQIDMLSGNLNFSVPLIKAMGRGNWSVTFALSYNSQVWRQDSNGTVWNLGQDVGAGYGWKLQAGSIQPLWYNGSTLYYLYTDATGAQYVLDQQNGNIWSSLQGIYVWYDSSTDILHFRDGSFWNMNVLSEASEQDAGTQYPSQMEDSNGNFIALAYARSVDNLGYSSRVYSINDARGPGEGGFGNTYYLEWWSGAGLPHLQWIANGIGTSESYEFTTASQTLLDPFSSGNYGTVTTLQAVTVEGLGISHSFVYDSSGEMTSVTTPLGGQMLWTYLTYHYPTRSYREVWYRTVNSGPNKVLSVWYIDRGKNENWHTAGTLHDTYANSVKRWTFSAASDYTAGLTTMYRESGSSGYTLEKDFTWATTTSGNPYVNVLTTQLDPGTAYTASTTAYQTVDGYGNLTSSQVYDYANGATGARTYNYTYTTYPSYYIFDRLKSATVTPQGGTALTLSSTIYDGACGSRSMIESNATNNHDPAYGLLVPRGNPTWVSGLNGADMVCTVTDTAGVPYYSADSGGHSVSIQSSSNSNFSLPSSIQPNGNSAMATSATYSSSWAVANMTGPNGEQGTTTYDAYGRPSQTTVPDGATTTYTYTYTPGASTQTATVDGRWRTTTVDGFGRTTRVQSGNGGTVLSTVDTTYAACACSPFGKISAVSQLTDRTTRPSTGLHTPMTPPGEH